MKIVNAHWEKRNLGVTTAEVTIERSDTPEDMAALEQVCRAYEYVVVKLPSGMADCAFAVQRMGFLFIEAMLHHANSTKISLSPAVSKLLSCTQLRLMSQSEIQWLRDEAKKGLFSQDRISLDPFFSKEQAAMRFAGWMGDLQRQEAQFWNVLYDSQPISYFILSSRGNKTAHIPLLGAYPHSKDAGMSALAYYATVQAAKDQGFTRMSGAVSSNNTAALRMALESGAKINHIEHVFIKHRE